MVSKEFTERLEERIAEFTEDGGQFELQEVLALMFEGIQNNYALTMAYVVDVENHDGHLYYHEYDDGTETAFAFTAEPDIRNNCTVGLSLRVILDEIMENDACDGILINPGEDNVFISKNLLETGLNAGYALKKEEIEQEVVLRANMDKDHELVFRRPLPEEAFAEIESRINDLEHGSDDFLKISFLGEKSSLFAHVLCEEVGVQLAFGIDMSAFNWDEPLVLGKSMPTDEAIRLLKRVCVDKEDPNTMEEVEEFHQTDLQ